MEVKMYDCYGRFLAMLIVSKTTRIYVFKVIYKKLTKDPNATMLYCMFPFGQFLYLFSLF